MNVTVMEVLQYLVPDAKVCVWEDDIDRIVWNDERPMPVKEEIMAAYAAAEADKATKDLQKHIINLEAEMHAYIESRYNTQWKLYLVCAYLTPGCSDDRKKAIEAAWTWAESIVAHYVVLVGKLQDGQKVSEKEYDWSAFDQTDPCLTLATLPA